MRLMLVIISLLIIQLAFGQSYHPLPTSRNYYWLQHSICNNFRYVIRYEKDTVIHTKNYNVYSQRDIAQSPSLCPAYITRGFIHQDTTQRRAYLYLPHKDTTVLLYDFKLNLHDSTVLYNVYLDKMVHLRVEKMENMKDTTGNPIKAYWTNDMNLYIESLGTLWGGLYGHNQMGAIQNSKPEELVCFGTINPFKVLTNGDALDNQVCVINSLNENGALTLSLYPTLAYHTVQFNISQVSGPVNVSVYDTKGQLVLEQTMLLDADKGALQVGQLPVGIYQVRLQSGPYEYVGRFVKAVE